MPGNSVDERTEGNVDPATLDCSFLSPFQETGGDCRPKVRSTVSSDGDRHKEEYEHL